MAVEVPDKITLIGGNAATDLQKIDPNGATALAPVRVNATGTALETSVVFGPPSARLTLTTGVAVLSSDVTSATALYYTPYQGNTIPIPATTGGVLGRHTFSELTLTLNVTNYLSGKNYDIFVFFDPADGTTIAIGSATAWGTDTARADSLGTAEGMLVNDAAVTMRNNTTTYSVGAKKALYVGTFRCSANGQTEMTLEPAPATGGAASKLFVWNNYNRRLTSSVNSPSDASWTYTTDTYRERKGSTSMRIGFVVGLAEGSFSCTTRAWSTNASADVIRRTAIGYDSTGAIATGCIKNFDGGFGYSAFQAISMQASLTMPVDLGYHFVTPLEASAAIGTSKWYGENPNFRTGTTLLLEM